MTRAAFFLRAVNVSGKNLIKMEDLRADLGRAGLTDVVTLLASGNVVASYSGDVEAARRIVEAAVSARIGRPAVVLLKSREELQETLAAMPSEVAAGEVMAVALTGSRPDAAALRRLEAMDGKGDTATPIPGAILLCCRKGQAETPYTTDRLERVLGVSITARARGTLEKVLAKLG